MKIALIGNVCNNMYNIGLALKKHTSITPHLYIGENTDIHSNPLHNDPNAKNQMDWVFYDKRWEPTLVFKKLNFTFIKKLRSEKYDIIIVSDIGVWLAPFVKHTKFYFWTTGADITRMPFPITFNFLYKGFKSKCKAWSMAIIQRWSIKYIDYFLTQPFMPFKLALKKLNIPANRILNAYFPIILNTDIFKFNDKYVEKLSIENLQKLSNFKFKIFHPSRIMISKNEALINSGQWKGNEMLLEGLRVFIDKYGVNDICIFLPQRKSSMEMESFKNSIIQLHLEKNVVWVNGVNDEGFDKQEMVALYSLSDLVVDEFGIGWFGSIVVEAAACSKPIMCYLDQEVMQELYPWHPIISVNTPETIAEEIAKLYYDKNYSTLKGIEGRNWALEFHSSINAGKKYAKELVTVINKK